MIGLEKLGAYGHRGRDDGNRRRSKRGQDADWHLWRYDGSMRRSHRRARKRRMGSVRRPLTRNRTIVLWVYPRLRERHRNVGS